VVSIAGYIAVAGGVISAVSQITVDEAALLKAEQEIIPKSRSDGD
jgi:hypothetical protein